MRSTQSQRLASSAFILQPRVYEMNDGLSRVVLVLGRNDGAPIHTLDGEPLQKVEVTAVLKSQLIPALRREVSTRIDAFTSGRADGTAAESFLDHLVDKGWTVRAPSIPYYAPGEKPAPGMTSLVAGGGTPGSSTPFDLFLPTSADSSADSAFAAQSERDPAHNA